MNEWVTHKYSLRDASAYIGDWWLFPSNQGSESELDRMWNIILQTPYPASRKDASPKNPREGQIQLHIAYEAEKLERETWICRELMAARRHWVENWARKQNVAANTGFITHNADFQADSNTFTYKPNASTGATEGKAEPKPFSVYSLNFASIQGQICLRSARLVKDVMEASPTIICLQEFGPVAYAQIDPALKALHYQTLSAQPIDDWGMMMYFKGLKVHAYQVTFHDGASRPTQTLRFEDSLDVTCVNVHLDRNRPDARQTVLDTLSNANIIAGDFNAPLSEPLHHFHKDAWEECGAKDTDYATYKGLGTEALRLDWILFDKLRVQNFRRVALNDVSDHFGVFASFVREPV